MDFISALAAGNQARLPVDVESGGFSPCTLALAAAARHTGGCLVCVRHEQEEVDDSRSQIERFDLGDAVEFELGKPSEVISQFKNIDFGLIDHMVEDCMEIFLAMDMNLGGSVVVVSNLFHGRRRVGASYGQLVRGREGTKSVLLPIGEGMEVTRIRKDGMEKDWQACRKPKRTFLVYEQYLTDVVKDFFILRVDAGFLFGYSAKWECSPRADQLIQRRTTSSNYALRKGDS
ncbi:hypothetical protein COCNU_01G021470 [Cocos nucifera]|uniref:Uncharacterized protein n=1 Tax=Cocos nucifera TaxID=13894 RepID=A0A8K0MW12_COCNU|nr:hypothetical protein COCNU_01G021470 [Cocos nucifera]